MGFMINTALMWGFYILSYFCLSSALDLKLLDIWTMLHSEPETSTYLSLNDMLSGNVTFYLVLFFLIFPIVAAILYSFYRIKIMELPNNLGVRQVLLKTVSLVANPAHAPFVELNAYNYFLIVHFSGKRTIIGKIGASGFLDCRIVKFFSGGSDATTALVLNGKLKIRKVVLQKSRMRLMDQFNWLKSANQNGLSVPEVRNWREATDYVYYEMPFDKESIDFYEWLCNASDQERMSALSKVLREISKYHQKNLTLVSKPELLNDYLEHKVIRNINNLKESLSDLFNINDFYINGESFSFREWEFLYDLNLLETFIQDTFQTDIHGDLTIDNIVISQSQNLLFIDPNPSTSFKTRLMDYAKLAQSLHFGYEAYLSDPSCVYYGNQIFFDKKYPSFYKRMYASLISKVEGDYGVNATRELRIHEIIHYIRLLSYKFSISKETGVLFFAITCLLIREFKSDYIANKSRINRF